jgi:hypothetical protein
MQMHNLCELKRMKAHMTFALDGVFGSTAPLTGCSTIPTEIGSAGKKEGTGAQHGVTNKVPGKVPRYLCICYLLRFLILFYFFFVADSKLIGMISWVCP